MTKVSETTISVLKAEHDRLSSKAKRQAIVAQATLDVANQMGKTIKELAASNA